MSKSGIVAKLHVWHKMNGQDNMYTWCISLWKKNAPCSGHIEPPAWHAGFATYDSAHRAGLRLLRELGLEIRQ